MGKLGSKFSELNSKPELELGQGGGVKRKGKASGSEYHEGLDGEAPLCLSRRGLDVDPGPVEARVEMRKKSSWALLGEAQHSGLGPAPWLWNWESGPA